MRGACQDADLILHTLLLTTGGHTVARELGIRDISIQFFPVFACTGLYTNPALPAPPPGWPPALRAAYNRFSHDFWTFFFWNLGHGGLPLIRLFRSSLPRKVYWPFRGGRRIPLVYPISRAVLPPPQDWPENVFQTGYWFLDSPGDYQPPAELSAFLAEGEPPVCLTFSSAASRDTPRVQRAITQALERFTGRVVLLTGWAGWQGGELPGNVLALPAAPHDWLFPRVSAVAHHGGAGTTAAALRAGIPALIAPFSADQPFWARRVSELGAGPPPVPFSRLTSERLLAGLEAVVSNPAYRQHARQIGDQIRQEDGVAEMVQWLEHWGV
jgi:UDP:flavonoid glycosyltransferase YjiC (YdhE family)